jgi:RNA polymerase sigma-70 factor (ECF subfamily)
VNSSDKNIVQLVLNGQTKEFEILVKRYQPGIEGFVIKQLKSATHAGDIVQEVFLTAYCNLAKLKNPEQFKSWLFGIAYRKCMQHFHSARKEMKMAQKIAETVKSLFTATSSDESEEVEGKTLGLLDKLQSLDAVMIWLHYIEDFSYREIAEIVELKEAAIRQRCRRALARIREMSK